MLGLCERFKCLPHELLAAPADPLWHLLAVERLGMREEVA